MNYKLKEDLYHAKILLHYLIWSMTVGVVISLINQFKKFNNQTHSFKSLLIDIKRPKTLAVITFCLVVLSLIKGRFFLSTLIFFLLTIIFFENERGAHIAWYRERERRKKCLSDSNTEPPSSSDI